MCRRRTRCFDHTDYHGLNDIKIKNPYPLLLIFPSFTLLQAHAFTPSLTFTTPIMLQSYINDALRDMLNVFIIVNLDDTHFTTDRKRTCRACPSATETLASAPAFCLSRKISVSQLQCFLGFSNFYQCFGTSAMLITCYMPSPPISPSSFLQRLKKHSGLFFQSLPPHLSRRCPRQSSSSSR